MKLILKQLCISISLVILSISSITAKDSNFELSKRLTVFHNILKEINLLYIDSVDNERALELATAAILKDLDPYTQHIHGYESINFQALTDGEYAGIGARWWSRSPNEHIYQLLHLYKNSPAEKIGLRIGDQAVSVNNERAKNMSFSEFISKVSGLPNTEVKLTVKRFYRDKSKLIDFLITRKKIKVESVLYKEILEGDIGYIFLSSFTKNTEWEVKETIAEFEKKGIKGLIIDVRGNPGGLIKQGLKTANLFIDKDIPVLETKARIPQLNKSYTTTKKPIAPDLPLAIMINHDTSSTAEVFAGILQDLDRAVITGIRSYGKGLIQKTRDLGFGEKLKLTTSQFYIPSGRSIQGLDHRRIGKKNDSKKFNTRNGRIIYGGGGITPDIYLNPESYHPFTLQLLRHFHVAHFVNWYCKQNKNIKESFKATDKTLKLFTEYLKKKNYTYESADYLDFEKIEKDITSNSLYKRDSTQLNTLFSKIKILLKPTLDESINTYRDELKILLTEEIRGCTFGIDVKYHTIISSDDSIKETSDILLNPKKYKDILDGSVLVHSAKKPDFNEK